MVTKVQSELIANNAILTQHIDDNQVTGDQLADNITIAGTLTSTGAFTSPGIDDNADANAITIDSSEKVGIGTTSPTLGLSVGDGKGVLFGPSGSSASMYVSPDHENTLQGGYGIDSDGGDLWINYRGYQNGTSRFRDFRVGDGKENLILFVDGSAGNVGIGTSSPGAKLDINLSGAGDIAKFTGTSITDFDIIGNPPEFNLEDSSSTSGQKRARLTLDSQKLNIQGLSDDDTAVTYNFLSCDLSNGRVGIGTTSPANNLHIHTDAGDEGLTIKSTGDTSNALIFDANRSGAGSSIGEIQNKWNGTAVSMIASVTGSDTSNKDDGELIFYTASAGSLVERMRVKNNGGVSLTGNHQFNFRANGASNPGNGAVIVFDAVQDGNAAGCYSTSTGAYQAAITGWYMVSVGIRYDSFSGSANQYVRPQLRYLPDGGSTWQYPHQGGWVDPIFGVDIGSGDYLHASYTVPMYLSNGDQIQIMNNGNCTNSVNHDESHFGVIFMG